MIRMAILGSAAALTLSLPAAAQQYGQSAYGNNGYYQQQAGSSYAECERARRNKQTAGGLFGAVAGGLLGAALADGDDDDRYRRGRHGYSRYGRGYNRGYGRGYGRYHRDDDDGNQAAGAIAGALIGGVAGTALGGSTTNCNRQAQVRQPYAYDNSRTYNQGRQVRYDNSYEREPYRRDTYNDDLRPGEELYGGSPRANPAWNDPEYGATTRGYNAGYSAPRDTGECRTVYRGDQPATACNVGGDRWEFVD